MKKHLKWILGLSFVFCFYCGKGKPDNDSPLVIVSSDTLTASKLDAEYTCLLNMSGKTTDSLKQTQKDSIRNILIEQWMNRKLILRKIKEEHFKTDSVRLNTLRSLYKNRKEIVFEDFSQITLYLNEIKTKNPVTRWDAQQEMEKLKKENPALLSSFESVKKMAEKNKLILWINELRSQGGFKILERSITQIPGTALKALLSDSTTQVLAAITTSLFPAISKDITSQIDRVVEQLDKIQLDANALAEMKKLFEKPAQAPKPAAAPSKAHLFRKPPALKATIEKYLPEIQENYKKELKRNFSLKGKIVVQMVIDEKGDVVEAQIADSEIDDKAFMENLVSSIKKWNFGKIPSGSGLLVLNYPFEFSPKD
jgi:hypothetical protein